MARIPDSFKSGELKMLTWIKFSDRLSESLKTEPTVVGAFIKLPDCKQGGHKYRERENAEVVYM